MKYVKLYIFYFDFKYSALEDNAERQIHSHKYNFGETLLSFCLD